MSRAKVKKALKAANIRVVSEETETGYFGEIYTLIHPHINDMMVNCHLLPTFSKKVVYHAPKNAFVVKA